jgi:hypothetical protein
MRSSGEVTGEVTGEATGEVTIGIAGEMPYYGCNLSSCKLVSNLTKPTYYITTLLQIRAFLW